MVEPVSIISTVAGITAAGIKLSCALYNICDNIASSQDQIEELASDLTDFTSIVKELGKLFERPKRVYSEALTTSLLEILEKCKRQFQQVRRMIGKTESEAVSVIRFKSRVAWVFRESKVRGLMARLDSTKLTLMLMLQTLKMAAEDHQNDHQDRQLLANMIRTQQRSLKTLIVIEQSNNDQHQTPTAQPGTEVAAEPVRQTLDVDILGSLQRAVPYVAPKLPSPVASPTIIPQPSPVSPTESTSSIAAPQLFTPVNLGTLYPLWKDRVLDNVDDLFRRWTTVPEPIYEMDAGPVPALSLQPEQATTESIERFEQRLVSIDEETADVSRREQRIVKDGEQFAERRKKIAEWFRKRERGLCEFDDSTMQRLGKEAEMLDEKRQENEKQLQECRDLIGKLDTEKAEIQRRVTLMRQPINQRPIPVPATSPPHMTDRRSVYSFQSEVDMGIPWLDEYPSAATNGDSDDELSELSSSQTVGSSDHPDARRKAAEPQSDPSSAANSGFSLQPMACLRKAYRPPEPFSGGQNVLSHVLRTMGYPPLWFTATKDVYQFRLGDHAHDFYTVQMASEDLTSYDNSSMKWTVIGKPWAHPKALTALAWPFVEDSLGYMWIEKELGWYEVSRIAELSWDLLDRALYVSSRDLVAKRSTEEKRRKSFLSSRISSDQKGGQGVADHHKAFFHDDDVELRRRIKPNMSRFRSVS